MIVTAHQPSYLPGVSLIEKIERSDAVIWLDAVQFTHGGFTNRQKMRDGSWLTVPVDHETTSGPINEVLTSEHDPHWPQRHARTLRQHYGTTGIAADICRVLHNDLINYPPRGRLIDLNLAILELFVPRTTWQFQSLLSHSTQARISEQLARMVEQIGGTVYLSGPSGVNYLDEFPFLDRGIRVEYFDRGPLANPCILERYRTKTTA